MSSANDPKRSLNSCSNRPGAVDYLLSLDSESYKNLGSREFSIPHKWRHERAGDDAIDSMVPAVEIFSID